MRRLAVADPRSRRALLIAGVVMMALAGALVVFAFQPATANRLGYALPRANGLPSQFSYQGMTYHAPDYCAGASSCDPARAKRDTETTLAERGIWPLKQVALLPTLFGPSHPILEPVNDAFFSDADTPYSSAITPLFLYIPDPATPGAYVYFQRDGAP
jgi:hypothetical protein